MDDKILEKLDEILKRLEKIEIEIEYLKKGNDNMSEHISFIENVYETVKNPFYFIMNKIRPIEGIPEKPKSLTQ
jgi:hypothetical protein